jgi:hypothetical protein
MRRVKDTDNYYVTRANGLGNNVSIYHTVKGQRVSFKSVSSPVRNGPMAHTARRFRGEHIHRDVRREESH